MNVYQAERSMLGPASQTAAWAGPRPTDQDAPPAAVAGFALLSQVVEQLEGAVAENEVAAQIAQTCWERLLTGQGRPTEHDGGIGAVGQETPPDDIFEALARRIVVATSRLQVNAASVAGLGRDISQRV